MALLNYTTSISAEKTVGEIQSKLAKAGAHQILNEYDGGTIQAVSFRIRTKFGDVAFRLPANTSAVEAVLKRQFPRKFGYYGMANDKKREQAARVSWRIIKDWIEAQLALIETGQATVEQVFLPYAQDSKGQTVYEFFLERKFDKLALPAPSKIVQMENDAS